MVRLASGVVLAAIFFALVWFTNETVLLVVALAVAALAVHELVQLFRAIGADVHAAPTLVATWGATIVVPFPHLPFELVLAIGLVVIAVWSMAGLKHGPTTADLPMADSAAVVGLDFSRAILGAAASVLAAAYIGIGLGSLVAIFVYGGRGAVILLVTTIIVSDTAQYYTGRAFGRRPLAPAISPKKTMEGAIGGFVLAPLFLAVSAYYFLPAATDQTSLVLLGLVLVIAGVAGDLFESMLKRAAGAKDSAALIPGHGGMLDRIDALLFASPLFYLYLRWLFA
jgi:phosphatidate cytidylyltransferase